MSDEPMLDLTVPASSRRLEELRSAGVSAKPGVILADAGYWKNDAIEAIVCEKQQSVSLEAGMASD